MPEKNFTQIFNDLIRSDKLSANEKVVLNVLLSYGDCEKIYLSQAKIAEQSNISRNSVQRVIMSLKNKRYISTETTVDRSTLIYKLLTKTVTPQRGKGYTCEVEGVTPVRGTSNKSISNTILEKEKIKEKKEIELPDWLNKEAWESWVQHRKEKRQTLTPLSVKGQLKLLEKNKSDHVEILNQSITNGYAGLFPLKNKPKQPPTGMTYKELT